MDERRDSVDHHRHVPLFRTFIEELSHPCTLEGMVVPLENVHVVADPLLDDRCGEGGSQTEDQAHEPVNVHSDV